MMGKTKRIIGIFLGLVLVLGTVPMIGLTSKAATYAIRIGDGEVVTDRESGASGTGWSYAPATDGHNATLTLTNANISGGYGISSSAEVGDINIVLVGNNTITSNTKEGIKIESGSLAISGEGSLTVSAGSDGINANSVTIDSGDVTISGNGENGSGISAYNGVEVNGGIVNVSGTACGIYVSSASVTINGGTVVAGSSECGSGITANVLNVNSGTKSFVAVGKEKALDCNYIKNEIPGAGWTNTEGTEGEAYIAINKDQEHSGTDLESYKKVRFPQRPEVIEGANQTVSAGSPATFRINKEFGFFQDGGSVEVDGKEVDLKYYDAESGSTIITLNGEFTKNLSEGEHVLAVKFDDNTEANTKFTITKEAPGSDPSADSGEATSPTNTDNSSANNTTANNSSTSDAKGKAPKTSDTLPIGAVALIIIGIGTIGVVVYRRRRL